MVNNSTIQFSHIEDTHISVSRVSYSSAIDSVGIFKTANRENMITKKKR